ncbi:MAG: redoxin domain-containing protein [Candidatus Heimdallarchaeota archaeon]|nr:MAG: redoxin domain-containing protein [Candidatus Heimdallarchaeota archaeon]
MAIKRKYGISLIVFLQLLVLITPMPFSAKPIGSDVLFQLPNDTPAPDFTLTDFVTNVSFSLSDFQGKVVILDLFATWCPPCVDAIPKIREISLSYSVNDLVIISIDIDSGEDEQLVEDFIEEHQMDWWVAFDNSSIVSNNYGSGYIPTLYVIDQNQIVTYSEIGFDFEEVLNTLDQLGIEPTLPISPNGSLGDLPFFGIVPTIFIVGIGFMVVFIIGAVIYGRYQQRKQREAYQVRYGFNQHQKIQTSTLDERAASRICPNCNRSSALKAKFCLYCGSDLREDSSW